MNKDAIDLRWMGRRCGDLRFAPKYHRPLFCFLPRIGWRRMRIG